MKIEHFAFNIQDAKGMVQWYHEYCMPIWVEREEPVYCAFLGEAPTLVEIYSNPTAAYFEPVRMAPLTCHLAFFSETLAEDRDRLVNAGATLLSGEIDSEGYGLLMLRCPWGLSIQLCKRKEALVR